MITSCSDARKVSSPSIAAISIWKAEKSSTKNGSPAGPEVRAAVKKDGIAWRSQRLAQKAKWTTEIYTAKKDQRKISAMVLGGDKIYLGGTDGELHIVSTDGKLLAKKNIPSPLWDCFAIGNGRLYVSTKDGKLLCLGEPTTTISPR